MVQIFALIFALLRVSVILAYDCLPVAPVFLSALYARLMCRSISTTYAFVPGLYGRHVLVAHVLCFYERIRLERIFKDGKHGGGARIVMCRCLCLFVLIGVSICILPVSYTMQHVIGVHLKQASKNVRE